MVAENQRYVTISRQKRFWASIVKFFCVIDGVIVAELKNGKTISFPISTEQHEFFIYASLTAGEFCSNKVIIEGDGLDKIFQLNVKSGWWNGNGELTLVPQ